jgi:hypothetical protein
MNEETHAKALSLQYKIDKDLPRGDGFTTRIDNVLETVMIELELHNVRAISVHRPYSKEEVEHIVQQMMSEMATAVGLRLVHILGIRESEKEKKE